MFAKNSLDKYALFTKTEYTKYLQDVKRKFSL